jgi:tRNA A-37 threonylcarbamoyl transferase component Bud32
MSEPQPITDAPSSDAPSSDADLSGRRLGDFQLLRRLGRGAMAEVYLAEQQSLQRQVAIKVLKSSLATDESYVRRFHNEAQAAASLVHANIVQVHEVGCKEGIHYIAQEYVPGQNLRELISRQGSPDLRLAVHIIRQVALALQKASERGIVHRDIKPENIMLSRDGDVKVADFGLARLSGNSELNLTQVGITMGTPLYMSPEQIEGRAIDPRSDLYSLGVTCFHMLTGSPPFLGETALGVAVQHLKTAPARLEQLRPDLPPALCRIVHKLLSKKPDDRYASARELLADLRGLQIEGLEQGWWDHVVVSEGLNLPLPTGRHSATQQLAAVMKTTALATHRRRRYRLAIAAGLALAFAGGGAAAWLVREPSLLAGAEAATIPKQNSAQGQFIAAQMQLVDREAWLKSVAEYFPRDAFYVARATQELARLYLQQNRLEEGLKLFRQLAAADESEAEQRAYGLAGEAVVLTMQGNYQRAAQVLAELGPLRSKLDPRMSQLVLYPLSVNRRALGQQSAHEWDEWKKTLPPEESPDSGG